MNKITLTIISLLISGSAFSNYKCSGKLNYVGVDNNLHLNNGHGVHNICSIQDNDRCKMWASMALSAQARDVDIHIYYSDSTGKGESACENIGSWVKPSDEIYFVSLWD